MHPYLKPYQKRDTQLCFFNTLHSLKSLSHKYQIDFQKTVTKDERNYIWMFLWFIYQLFKNRRYFLALYCKISLYTLIYEELCWSVVDNKQILYSNHNSMPEWVLHGLSISGFIWSMLADMFLKKWDKIFCVTDVPYISCNINSEDAGCHCETNIQLSITV